MLFFILNRTAILQETFFHANKRYLFYIQQYIIEDYAAEKKEKEKEKSKKQLSSWQRKNTKTIRKVL